LANIG